MPFIAPALRAVLLLTSAGGLGYTFYHQNPAFKAFVDRISKQITDFWDDILAHMGPEERARAREVQRRVLLDAFPGHAAAGEEDSRQQRGTSDRRHGELESSTTASKTGASDEQDGKLRRRKLWEIAEQNAAEIRKRAAAREHKTEASDGATAAGIAPEATEDAAASALHSHPISSPAHLDTTIAEETREALHPDPPTLVLDAEHEAQISATDAALTSPTSPNSRMSTPTILTPPSPSLASVSETSTNDDTDPPLADIDDILSEQGFNAERIVNTDIDAASDTDTETMSMSQVSAPRSVSDFGAARTPASEVDAERDDVTSLDSGFSGSESWTSAAASESGDQGDEEVADAVDSSGPSVEPGQDREQLPPSVSQLRELERRNRERLMRARQGEERQRGVGDD